jgi:hypothetical protein
MRHDKLTTKLQEARSDAQSLAVGRELMAVLNLTASLQGLKHSGFSWRMGTT